MTYYRATPNGPVPFMPDEIAAWDAELAANAEAGRAALLNQIDNDVDALYGAVIGNRGTEYALAESEANAFKAGGYVGTAPGSVQSWATAKSQSATWAADDIIATAVGWRTAQAQIRATRLAMKESARAAAIAGLPAVRTNWNAFMSAARAGLGL